MVPAEEVQEDNPQNASVPKYERTSGTCTQKGTKFEIKMAALVYLRDKRFLKSFAISINDALAGKFDDIVLAYSSGSKKYELLMQLKHLGRNVTKAALASESGKLSLKELFSSVKSRFIPPASASSSASDNTKDTVCILFTNTAVKFTNTAVNLGTFQRASNIDPLVTDLLCTSDTDSVLEVNINGEVCTTFKEQPGATEFVRNFFIFSSQADVDHLDEIIKQEFIKLSFRIIPNYRNLETAYLDNIETYWDMTGEVPYLTEDWRKWSSFQHLLSGNEKLLPHIRFDEQVLNILAQKLLHSNHQKIHVVCRDSSVLLTSMKVNQALVKLRNQRHLFTSTDEQKENLNIVLKLWESNSYDILIIGWDNSNCTYKLEIDESIFLKKQKKLILISDGRRSTSDIFTDKLVDCWHNLDEAFSFSQLDNSSQETVLNQPIHLQGIEVKLSDLGVRKEILGESLISFLNCGNIQLGRKLEFPCKSYIPRTLYKQVAIKKDILAVAEIPDKVCVEGVTNEELRDEINKVRMSKDLDIFQEPTKVKSVADADLRSQHSVDPIHTLEIKDNMLYWKCSSGDPGLLYEFLNVTEGEIEDVRHFIENCKTSNPKEDVLVTAGLRKVIVAGEPGIGKSDLFMHIAHKLKDLYPDFWVIPLNLEDVAKYMNEKENHIVNKESVFRMLTFATAVQDSLVAKTFLEEAIEYSGKIFILCDGFDEIFPKYSELVLEIFNTILETKVSGLWVSSRQAAVDKLETCLQAKAFSLEPFTEDEAFRYLSDILGWDDAKKMYELIQKSTSEGANHVSSNPLHLMMICDLKVSGEFPTDGKMLNLYEMYRSFTDIKLEKYLNNTVKDTHMHMRHIYAKEFMESHMICSIIALDILNELQEEQRSNILEYFNRYREIVGGCHEKTGIIDGLSEDGRPRFVHRTFAEYFAALWLEINKDSNLKYIGKITFHTHQNVLREVFNRLLAKNCPIHLAVLDNDILDLRKRLKENPDLDSKDAGGRTPLHLASLSDEKVAIKMMKVVLYYKPKLELRDKLLNSTPLYYAVKAEMWDGVKLLLQHGAHVENSITECSYVMALKEEVRCKNSRFTPNLDLEFEINWPIFVEYKTILHLAAISGFEDCFKMLIENGANVEVRDIKGNTPLHDAVKPLHDGVRYGNESLVRLLLMHGADVNVQNKDGNTPLHLAVSSENELIVELLFNSGAFAAAVNKNGATPLHIAVRKHNLRMVRTLLQYKASTSMTDKHGDTPLHVAVREQSGSISIIELLFQNGARANVKNKYGDTPLHEAIRYNNLDVVQLLLDRGASTTVKNITGETPLHVAVRHRCNLVVVQLLLDRHSLTTVQNKYGETPLHVAIRYHDFDVVRLLLDRHESTTVQNNDGDTPLHEAVRYSKLDVVQLLLDRHASITVQNNNGDTPLHVAVKRRCNLVVVQLLLDRNASTTVQNNSGETPLHEAIRYHDVDVVRLLLDRHESTTVQNNDGDTPLHVAVRHRYNLFVVQLLLDRHSLTTVQNKYGETPLHIAVKYSDLEMVQLLLERHSLTTVQNKYGETPLHVAIRYHDFDVVELLLDRHASTTVQNNDGDTPLHEAVRYNRFNVVQLLLDRHASTTIQNNNGETPLHIAVKDRCNLVAVQLLLDRHASTTVQNNNGDTPLHEAIRYSKLDVVQLMLDRHASTTVQNNNGDTPLHIAVFHNNLDVVQLLLDRHTSTTVQNNNGETPLHVAVKERDSDIVELLLKNKACANDVNKDQDTPLHIAAKYSDPKAVELLLRYGAKSDAVNKDGDTPLHVAIGFRNWFSEDPAAIVTQLLEKDKSCSLIANNVGDTPLHIAVEKGYSRIVKLLLKTGVNMNVINRNGDTPVSIAEKFGHTEIVTMLQDIAGKC